LKEIRSMKDEGGDATLCPETFKELFSPNLPDWLLKRCNDLNYKNPTILQKIALRSLLFEEDFNDVVIQAQTGSGKTLTYLLPLLTKIDSSRSCIQGIIIVPTRELGLQVSRVAKRLAAGSSTKVNQKIMIMSVLQGSQNRRQRAWAWAEPPHIVISTPSELLLMLSRGGFKYNSVNMVVVDEVDACLSLGKDLHLILSRYLSPTYLFESVPENASVDIITQSANDAAQQMKLYSKQRQTIFLSATIPQHHHFIKQCVQNQWTLKQPKHIHISPSQLLPPNLSHTFVVCRDATFKLAALRRILIKQNPKRVLIFCNEKRNMEEIAKILHGKFQNSILWKEGMHLQPSTFSHDKQNIIISVLRYEYSLSQRATAMEAFRGDSILNTPGGISLKENHQYLDNYDDPFVRIMFSTDLAARGLDIHPISHIIHFDLPDPNVYTHRSGRAGRLGTHANVISIITPEQEFVLQRLVNQLGLHNVKCISRQKK